MVKSMLLGAVCAVCLMSAPATPPQFGHSVTAVVTADAALYNESRGEGGVCGEVKAGTAVEIVEDRSGEWYAVAGAVDGQRGWMSAGALEIPPDTAANREQVSTEALENYVNSRRVESRTGYLLFTDLERQQTHVFTGAVGEWKLLRSLPCATGKNVSPTKRGLFACETRGEWFYSQRLRSGARYWIRFDGPYLFHSLAMDANGEVIDFTIGERVSSGCVRLAVEDARWLYENIPDMTAVLIV